jgi:hypothetical protein
MSATHGGVARYSAQVAVWMAYTRFIEPRIAKSRSHTFSRTLLAAQSYMPNPMVAELYVQIGPCKLEMLQEIYRCTHMHSILLLHILHC